MTPAWLLLILAATELRLDPPGGHTAIRAVGLTGGSLLVTVDQDGAPPMLGTLRTEGGDTVFTPRFAFQAGLKYRAVWKPASGAETVFRFALPARDLTPVTKVDAVYPSGGLVPENLLKVYVQFSGAMSRGEAYQRLRLRDAAGAVVPLAFLELDEELWDPDLRRLTLLIDPGRIKRGVRPLEEVGPALRAGQTYTLEVDAAWHDADGRPLTSGFQRSFRVAAADRQPIDLARWQLNDPHDGSRDALEIDFGEPLDRALAERMLQVVDSAGRPVRGSLTVGAGERTWRFTPARSWSAGSYAVKVNTALEDLAGNKVGRPFDVDRFEQVERRVVEAYESRAFAIRPAR